MTIAKAPLRPEFALRSAPRRHVGRGLQSFRRSVCADQPATGMVHRQGRNRLHELFGMIVEYANVFATAKLFVPIIVIAIVGVVLTELVMWLERRMPRWRQLDRERF